MWNINVTTQLSCPQNAGVLFVWSCKKTIAIMWMMAYFHFLIGSSLVVAQSNVMKTSKKLVAKNSTLVSKMFRSICLTQSIWTLLRSVTELLDQSEASIQVTWSLSTNQRQVFELCSDPLQNYWWEHFCWSRRKTNPDPCYFNKTRLEAN